MDKYIDSQREATEFSTLDAKTGYLQIKVGELDRDKTASTSGHKLYRFKRMTFGLQNAPDTFQRTTDVILFTLKWQFALDYLDDVVVLLRAPEEHIFHVQHVLTLLNTAGATLKLKSARSL